MLKININKYFFIIKNFDEKNIKKNKKSLKFLLKNKNFKDFLLSDVRFCYYFCEWVIEGKCPVLESAFISNSCYAFHYACYIINGRLPEALHNYMLTTWLSDKDDCAKRYFIWLNNKTNLGPWGNYL